MLESNRKIKAAFKYTDEFGDTAKLIREVESDHLGLSEGDILCELFRDFMVCCGFSNLAGKKVSFVDDK